MLYHYHSRSARRHHSLHRSRNCSPRCVPPRKWRPACWGMSEMRGHQKPVIAEKLDGRIPIDERLHLLNISAGRGMPAISALVQPLGHLCSTGDNPNIRSQPQGQRIHRHLANGLQPNKDDNDRCSNSHLLVGLRSFWSDREIVHFVRYIITLGLSKRTKRSPAWSNRGR